MQPHVGVGRVAVAIGLMTAACGRWGFEPVVELVDGAIPAITQLTVTNGGPGSAFETRSYRLGDPVMITWTAVAAERFGDGPIDLYVTTDGSSWTPVAERYGDVAGHPSSYAASYRYTAPSDGMFRFKLVATDLAGQTSIPVLSDVQNVAHWSVYAGTPDRGVGGTGRSVSVTAGTEPRSFAIDPVRGDIYAIDEHVGLIRMDAATGRTSRFMERIDAGNNFVDDGPLPEPLKSDEELVPFFDHAGRLYVMTAVYLGYRATIYQIDLAARRMRLYVGPAAAAMPSDVSFDESDSLYFLASCTPDTWSSTSTVKIMKLAQQADGRPGALTDVAGSCVLGPPPAGPVDARSASLSAAYYLHESSLAAWDNGAVIYFAPPGGPVSKILGGQLYTSEVACTGSLFYDRGAGRLYCADDAITAYVPNLTGATGDRPEVVIAATGGPGCSADGVDAAVACADAARGVDVDRAGRLVFADGAFANVNRNFRVRTLDGAGKISTVMGTLPFVGDGLPANVVRATFAGIYYKTAAEPAQEPFPAGLYFFDRGGPVLGHVDPETRVVSRLWGNQRQDFELATSGPPIGPEAPLGFARFSNGFPLTFDDAGLPWLRYNNQLAKLDDNRRLVALQTGSKSWEAAADGADPHTLGCSPYGLAQNLALAGQGAFMIGGFSILAGNSIRYLDFAAPRVTRLMGAATTGASPDTAVPGSVNNLRLDGFCVDANPCHVRYQAAEDRLYFGEAGRLRYITPATDPSRATLTTLFTAPSVIGDFVLSLDGSQLFYVMDGQLYCHDRTSGAAWCDDTALGPPVGLTPIGDAPNQLTWLDATNLLVSTARGEIYQYRLVP